VERWKIGETRILKTVDSRQNGRHILDCGHSIPDPRSWMPDNPLCKWPRTRSSPLGLRIESKVGARVPGVPSQAIDRRNRSKTQIGRGGNPAVQDPRVPSPSP